MDKNNYRDYKTRLSKKYKRPDNELSTTKLCEKIVICFLKNRSLYGEFNIL